MNSGVDQLQIYLLSKMSALELVRDAQLKLGIAPDQMKQIAASLSDLDQVSHPARRYEALIGPAIAQRQLGPDDTSEPFVGSIERRYRLPLWPNVDFVVHEHPAGYAWGEEFKQAHDVRPPVDYAAVKPWDWAKDFLLRSADAEEIVDRWTDYHETRLRFGGTTFQARFDLGLLQSWGRIPPELPA